MDKKIPVRDYNNSKVYYWFDNPFPSDYGILYLDLPPNTIYYRPCPDKRSRYNPDLIPAAISVASEIFVSNLTTSSDSPQLLLLTSEYPNPRHVVNKYESYRGRVKIEYCSSKRDEKYATKK